MNKSIGSLEFRSISRGIEVTNEIVKKSSVEIIYLKNICPGKFIVIVTGDEGAVSEAITYGLDLGEGAIVDSFILHAISDAVIMGIRNKYDGHQVSGAIGVMETNKVCAGIKALDKTLKESDVTLLKMQLAFAIGGKFVYIVTGSLSSIQYGFEQAKNVLDKGELGHCSIIPAPSQEMLKYLL